MTIHAEWIGGPQDGSTMDLRDGTRYVTVPVLKAGPLEIAKGAYPTGPLSQVKVPVLRSTDGRYGLVWSERQ